MGNSCGCCCKCSKTNYKHEQAETSEQGETPAQTGLTPVEFTSVADTLKTGDICVLCREGTEQTHYAMFVVYEDLGEHSPLLLLKGKTKPLPLELFKRECNKSLRHTRIVSANGRIFYGDYMKVLIYKLKRKQVITGAEVDRVTEIVRKLNYDESELKFIEDANTSDARRSQYVCTFMLAHVMTRLGCMSVQPHTVTPDNFLKQLNLEDPISIELPDTKEGPCVTGSAPFFVKLIDGIMAPSHITTVKFDDIADTLNTGDLVLFSGATTSGAVIKLFDNAEFSHIGIVIRRPTSAAPLIWEASTNRAGLVDIETGKVTQGVELLPLKHKIFSGWYNRVAIRQLIVSDSERKNMTDHLLEFKTELGERPYEQNKLQLIRSAIDFHQDYFTFLKNKEEDLSSLFCSELVAAAYQRMGLLEFNKTSENYKTSNEYTPDDFTSRRDERLRLLSGELKKEIYIEMKHH